MKYALASIGTNLVSILALAGAVYLMLKDKDGWGWLLIIAVVGMTHVKFINK